MTKDEEKALKKALKNEVSPLLIGLRNELKNVVATLTAGQEKAISNQLTLGTEVISKALEEIVNFKTSILPIRGKDYFTDEDITLFKSESTPKKGTDYFTDTEVKAFLKLVTPKKGKDYFDGKNGKNGRTPIKGRDYFTKTEVKEFLALVTPVKGKDYFDGTPGKKGADGTLITAEEIRSKLESLTGKKRLRMSAIQGLEEALNAKGGGGMGGAGNVTNTGITTVAVDGVTITGNGTTIPLSAVASSVAWGAITGTLASQADLQAALDAKEPTITASTSGKYWRGDKTFVTLDTSVVPENTNLYFTNARAIASTLTSYSAGAGTVSSADSIKTAIQKLDGNIGALVTGVSSVFGRTGAVTAQSGDYNTSQVTENTNLYYTQARFDTAFAAKTTDNLSEGSTNKYWTNARTIASTLTGYTSGAGTVASSDTILQAIQKLNGNDALKELLSNKATDFSTSNNTLYPSVAAVKNYVDTSIQGLSPKKTATVATTTTLPAYTYLSGVITMTSTGVVAIDGHNLALNDVVLVKNETGGNQPYNGQYDVTTAGAVGVALVLTRSTDMDSSTEFSGAMIPVGNVGSTNANSLWLCNPSGTVTVGVTNIPFTQLNGATDLIQGTGITISGNTISIDSTVATLTGSQALTNKTYNGLTVSTSTGTLTIANSKTVTINNTLTLAGTDSTTITFQGTDTYMGRATTDTMTNKTFDTAGTGNVFKINGTGITDKTGTGKAVLDTSPTLVTPTLGVATATSINKVAITAPASSATLTIADGKTATFNNSITFAGTDATTMTFPSASDTVAGLGTAQTFTKAQRGAFVTLTDAATIAVDASLGNNFYVVLGGNRTLGVPTNLVAGQSGVINIYQDITGSRTLAYSWCYQFVGGTAPTLSTGKLVFDQLVYMVNKYATATVTMTIASPGVVTWTGHGLDSGDRIQLTTTGALPTGLSASTTYWITKVDANSFKLSSSLANAQAGTFINTSGSQSGTHTATSISIIINSNLAIS